MDTILAYTKQKVKALFDMYPDEVHGFDHAQRVADMALQIATEEGGDTVMASLAGWLHDIGRAIEERPKDFPQYDSSKTHHELSYDMLRDWFREDAGFSQLSEDQKR
ncbi:MAG: hypothetical protein COU31_01220 [Candidatus Magasanikbacteria bacterium CG10_big_fil_rev_8_21_14_0_10_40_10]|uniref:HD domain-containing protein n=1 Tax=Candidatus Magasanikbacteria bacterium CG10_big_fil_rev_8_21_14_0_10_40_10 TaxID=1974648 RepID=A0A2M6W4N4_9BACT|nr:MAG: hypothetical protein COU31_01220 [Candidatus Magasanikbacteria bacterium CG10_big_fil_rev_8_21_14_0_10_40_10]